VHADIVIEAAISDRIDAMPVTRVADEVQVAIGADVMSP
jgi:hypothetical protein